MVQPLLKVTDLAKSYSVGQQTLQAFQHINFDIQPGECVALVGSLGAAKAQ